jgi:hypothetical protein
VTCYPAANPNEGFRKINIEIVTDTAKKYRVRARPGYRPPRGLCGSLRLGYRSLAVAAL